MTKPAVFNERPGQRGMTLIELMIAVLLTGIILSMFVAAYMVVTRTDRQTSQDAQSLAQLRVATDRIERDLRQARRVYQDSNGSRLHLWVDSDRDNQQDLSERVTFELTTDNGLAPVATGSAATLRRKTDVVGAAPMIVSTGMQMFPSSPTFAYSPTFTVAAAPSTAWTDTTLVSITLAADEAPGPYPGPRTLKTDLRMRNARTY
jgi:prepilin-type N-terminal cleavage/methylation domain-containing protein